MMCEDRTCKQCYPAEEDVKERKFWRVVIVVVIVLLVAAVVVMYQSNRSDKSYGSNGSNAMEKSK